MDMKKFAEELKRKSGDNGKKAWSLVELWYTRDGKARRLSLHDLHELSQAIAEELARIRAEARAEALKEAKRKALAWWFDPNTPSTPEAMGAAILADEPKEERGAEAGDLVWWVSHREAHVARADRELIEAFAEVSRDAGPIVLMRRAEVERRIEEAGR